MTLLCRLPGCRLVGVERDGPAAPTVAAKASHSHARCLMRRTVSTLVRTHAHVQVNHDLSREIQLAPGWKPATFRVDVVNLLDDKFQLRDGSDIGVFVPQDAPRRGVFAGIAQAF